MIAIEHKAFHLFREDAYAEYCWSVDAWGAYQPASFIYLCFEEFREHCAQSGLCLIPRETLRVSGDKFPTRGERYSSRHQYDRYFGLITRLETPDHIPQILNALQENKNVLVLLPTELIGCHYGGNKERLAVAIKAAGEIGLPDPEAKVVSTLTQRDAVWWEELQSSARLLVTRDCFVSDGYYLSGYGRSDENTSKIEALIKQLSIFKQPLIRCTVHNPAPTWPCHEPLSLMVEIVNHGPRVTDAEVSFEFPTTFEPFGPLERLIPQLDNLARMTFPIQVIPRVHGDYPDFLKVSVRAPFGSIPCARDSIHTTILPGYGQSLQTQAKKDDPGLATLLNVFRPAQSFTEIEVLPELMRVDPAACLNKIRIVAEKLVRLVLQKHSMPHNNVFSHGIQALQQAQILTARSIGYLNTVRVVGNLASHPSGEPLSETDVRIAAFALASVAEEVFDRSLL